MSFTPTDEQVAVLDAVPAEPKESLMVDALAGCAKTSTMTMVAKKIKGPSLGLAFNVRIKKELETQFPPNFTVLTLNSLGHRAWATTLGGKRLTLEERKLAKIISEQGKAQGVEITQDQWNDVRLIVTKAMQHGLVPSTFSHYRGLLSDQWDSWQFLAEEAYADPENEALLSFARSVLIEHVKQSFSGIISFDDQIYMSALYGGTFTKFPRVLTDESQDLSQLNQIMIGKSASDWLMCVGDPKQAIYAFRGADSNSMSNMRKLRKDWIDRPLNTTFRVPELIVKRQWHHAPAYKAYHTNAQGHFTKFPEGGGDAPADQVWSFDQLQGLLDATGKPKPTLAILCRNNGPLVKMAFKLIRKGIGCVMLGRDIGKGLESLTKKLFPDDMTPLDLCMAKLTEWQESECSKARINGQEGKISGITDRAECLFAVMDFGDCKTGGDIRKALKLIFEREYGQVTLSTGHRAKGFEWDVVIHLNPWLIPSKWARKLAEEGDDRPLKQEINLKYVIETRTKHTLAEASLAHFN